MPAFPKLGLAKRPRNSSDDPEEFRLSVGEHLEELRARIMRMAVMLAVGFLAGWFLEPPIYQTFSSLVEQTVRSMMPQHIEYKEVFKNVTEPFMLKLKLAFYIGLILALPFMVTELWGFIKPGLKPSERRPLQLLAPISVVLFFIGAVVCWVILPSAFAWFLSYTTEFPDTAIYQEPGTLVFFILKMMLAFGIGFQLPIVVYFLAKIGLIGPNTLSRYWRQITVVVFFASAILTPSADMFSMLMMAIPLTLLFFVSVFAVKLTVKPNPDLLGPIDQLDTE